MVKTLIVIGFLIQGVLRVCAGSLPLVLAPPETSPRPEENSYVSGLAFYSGKLYVGLGLGLMVVENGAAARLFAWEKKGTPVEWVSYDRANNLLWACLPWRHELARFDGKVWQAVPFPKPSRGFISRGDVLRGYRGVSNGRSFWFEGAGRAWTWRGPKSGKWTEVPSPPAVKPSNRPSPNLKRLLPTDGRTYCIRRDGGDSDELAWGLLNDSRTWDRVYAMNRPDIPDRLNDMMRGDSVWFLDGQTWNPVNCAAGKFLAEETVATTTDAYIRTKAGGSAGHHRDKRGEDRDARAGRSAVRVRVRKVDGRLSGARSL